MQNDMAAYLKIAVVVSYVIFRLIHLVKVFGEENEEVGELRLADGVVVRQSAALSWTVALGRLVVSHVLGQSRFQAVVEQSGIAYRRVSCKRSISRNCSVVILFSVVFSERERELRPSVCLSSVCRV